MIEKLDINLFPEETDESHYNKAKAKYIAEYKTYVDGHSEPDGYVPGFLFFTGYQRTKWVPGKYVKNPIQGEAEWNKRYPNGFTSWRKDQRYLNAYGEQEVIDTVNALVDAVNTLMSEKKK